VPITDTAREWITAREAAALFSVHPKTVQRACRRGLLRAELSGGTWLIARGGLEEALHALRGSSGVSAKTTPRKRTSMRRIRPTITIE
jgi:excisionase family DNA binding protein